MINMSTYEIEAEVVKIGNINSKSLLSTTDIMLKVIKVIPGEISPYCRQIKLGDILDYSTGDKVKVGSVMTASVIITNTETHMKTGPAFIEKTAFSNVKWKK